MRFFPRGNLRLLLTSPMGTTSTLLFERPRDVLSSSFDDWPFLSVHFWGEKADGRWTLQVINAGNRHVNTPGITSQAMYTRRWQLFFLLCKTRNTYNILFFTFSHTGILKKWQLIFYGTATNPIRLRNRQYNPVQAQTSYGFARFPNPIDHSLSSSHDYGDIDFFGSSTFQNYQGPYAAAASNVVQSSVATLDGASGSLLTNRLPGDTSASLDADQPASALSQSEEQSLDPAKRILHDCDPQCDPQGCYGKGPTHCIACKTYRLDK